MLTQTKDVALVAVDGVSGIPELKDTTIDAKKPFRLMSPDSDEIMEVRKFWNIDFKARCQRFCLLILTFVVLLICMSLTKSAEDDQIICQEDPYSNLFGGWIGLLLAFLSTVWLINFWSHAWIGCSPKQDAYLFSVHTRWSKVEGWAPMRVANTQLLFPYRPMGSVSEFSSIAGGQANHALLILCSVQWVVLMTLYASEVQNHSGDFLNDPGNILMVIGSAGIVAVGIFDANRFDHGMMIVHCLGAVLAVPIINITVFLQCFAIAEQKAEHNVIWILAAFLMTFSFSGLFGFCYWMRPSQASQFEEELTAHIENGGSSKEYLEEARPRIHRVSMQCLVWESVLIYFTMLQIALYVANWGGMPQCNFGCRNECTGCEFWC